MNHVRGDGEIVVEELRWPPIIGNDAANLSCRQKHSLRPCLVHPCLDLHLTSQVEILTRNCEKGAIDLR